jgi:hypothetical protein
MDLLCEKGKNLKNFINNFNFQNCVNTPTRVAHYKDKKTKVSRTTTSLIDVCIHNNNVVNKALAVDCPFSDHKFILIKININSVEKIDSTNYVRNLSDKNLDLINNLLLKENFKSIELFDDIENMWLSFKNRIMLIDSTFKKS